MRRLAVLVLLFGACSRGEPTPAAADQAVQAGSATSAAGSAAPVAAVQAPAPRPRPAALTKVTLKALGMHCEETCPMRVRMALADLPAVYELGFDVSTESVFVSFDASLGTAKEVTKPMLAAIKGAGYDPWLARETWPADAEVQVVTR